uniref:Sulfite exporter TauE/SafE family protein n=1 Tax=Lactuca sativa TaxID=4236 RepID=A0A9R1VK82_LACSA|nr:hypothetical protein LSAT_V11C500240790 [Lactuca sativa]
MNMLNMPMSLVIVYRAFYGPSISYGQLYYIANCLETHRRTWRIITVTVISLVTASMLASADRTLLKEDLAASAAVNVDGDLQNGSFVKFASSLFQTSGSGYEHVWPEMELGWKIVLGSFIGFCGAIFGSAAGVGGGGIFVPMLTLIIGFDPKSATGISKCCYLAYQ